MIHSEHSDAVLLGNQGDVLVRKTPGICGGDACIGNSRIMVWLLVALKNDGVPDAELLKNYPTLGPSDLSGAWEYYRQHPEEIEQSIDANDKDAD
jgi:uncharacterized protein (DUF433 family)